MNAKCTNQACAEDGVVKNAEGLPLDVLIICGACGVECDRTDEPWIDPNEPEPEPEVATDADPTQ